MEFDPISEAGTSGGRKPVSRRWLLGVSGTALLAAGCTKKRDTDKSASSAGHSSSGKQRAGDSTVKLSGKNPKGHGAAGPNGVLGANFNEDPKGTTFSALEAASASWLRGFTPMQEIKKGRPASGQRAIHTLLSAYWQGYGTILSLKFQYKNEDLPSPGSSEMDAELAKVNEVLHAVMDKVNILCIGNEPFLETQGKDKETKLNAFYEEVAKHVIAYRKKHFPSGCRTRLYMGALNHLDWKGGQTAATKRWMTFVRETPEIEGVDIHPHVDSPEGVQTYLNYILPRLRKDQKFLVTEFSLVLLYKKHMKRHIPAKFAKKYKLPKRMPVWRLLKKAAEEESFTPEKWHDFLSMSPWFESHKHFMRTQVEKFRRTGQLAVATYGVVQAEAMVTNIRPTKQPWLLNSLYASRTVKHTTNTELPPNYTVFDDFRALQRAQDRKPVHTGKTPTH